MENITMLLEFNYFHSWITFLCVSILQVFLYRFNHQSVPVSTLWLCASLNILIHVSYRVSLGYIPIHILLNGSFGKYLAGGDNASPWYY